MGWTWYILGDFFHKLIWSPCPEAMSIFIVIVQIKKAYSLEARIHPKLNLGRTRGYYCILNYEFKI
jgi:hypothetical protein